MRIVLIGPRGCGKTSVGRELAEAMKCAFIDLDKPAASQFQERTIEAIWAAHGEPAWRAAEWRALRGILAQPAAKQVIALGGGTPMIDEARRALLEGKRSGELWIAYLRCSVSTLADRLSREPGDRPTLTGRGTIEEIAAVLAQREPVYESIADMAVDADRPIEEVAKAILDNASRSPGEKG